MIRGRDMTRALLLASALILAACNQEPAAPAIEISDVWARAVAPGQKTGAIYLTIANKGDAPDALMSAKASVAPMTMIHRTTSANGIVSMDMVKSVAIPAGGQAVLAPNGTHLMMTGLAVPLSPGDRFFVDFTFEKSGHTTATGKVVAADAR